MQKDRERQRKIEKDGDRKWKDRERIEKDRERIEEE